jgi:hypothetical protein
MSDDSVHTKRITFAGGPLDEISAFCRADAAELTMLVPEPAMNSQEETSASRHLYRIDGDIALYVGEAAS